MADTFPRQYARTRRFTLGQPRAFTIFPDHVLFLRSLSGSDPRMHLWVLDLATGDERRLLDPAGLADDGDLPIAERARRERVRETATGVVSLRRGRLRPGRRVSVGRSSLGDGCPRGLGTTTRHCS